MGAMMADLEAGVILGLKDMFSLATHCAGYVCLWKKCWGSLNHCAGVRCSNFVALATTVAPGLARVE
jgi:hypothetical protein